ncbi:hypothetical protein [Nostoc sp.]
MTNADQPNRLDRIERVLERQLTKSCCNKLSCKTPRRARSVPSPKSAAFKKYLLSQGSNGNAPPSN